MSLPAWPTRVLKILGLLSDAIRTVRDMLSVAELAARPDFTVSTVVCREHRRGWSDAEVPLEHRIVLVRSGRFRRAGALGTADLDPTLAYLAQPGDEERFAHPAGGDVCTSVSITPVRWAALAGEPARPSGSCI
jgi:hypothetical protein